MLRNIFKIISLLSVSLIVKAQPLGIDVCKLETFEEKDCLVVRNQNIKSGKEICKASDNPTIILRESNYINGKLEGEFICRSFTGKVIIKTNYHDNKLQGEYRDFSDYRSYKTYKESWRIRYFEDGKQSGVEFFADSKGNVLEVVSDCYVMGHSSKTNLPFCLNLNYAEYDSSIKKHLKDEIKKNEILMNRHIEEKYSNGKMRIEAKIVNGQYEGSYKKYFENGILELEAIYKDGILQFETSFFESGAKKEIIVYEKKLLKSKTDFYENQKIKAEKKYSYENKMTYEDVKIYTDKAKIEGEYRLKYYPNSYYQYNYDGPYRLYHEDGSLFYDGRYVDGKFSGHVFYVFSDSSIDEKIEMGKIVSKDSYDLKAKKLKEHVEYFGDGSEKSRTTTP